MTPATWRDLDANGRVLFEADGPREAEALSLFVSLLRLGIANPLGEAGEASLGEMSFIGIHTLL